MESIAFVCEVGFLYEKKKLINTICYDKIVANLLIITHRICVKYYNYKPDIIVIDTLKMA